MDIKVLRQQTGLSQQAFAESFDIPVRTLQQWEQGRSQPAPYVIKLIGESLGILPSSHSIVVRKDDKEELAMPPKKVWRSCINDPFENVNRIYPLQQKKVQELLADFEDCPEVEEVIVFGSSVTPQCHIGSDVDIYVVLSKETNPINEPHDFEFDLWTNFSVAPRLLEEIGRKGVRVYG